MALTLKQQKFIDAYLGEANGNATKAAQLAGYAGNDESIRVEGSRLLTNANVRAEIEKRFKENCMGAKEVLGRLADQARGAGAYIDTSLGKSKPFFDVERMVRDGKGHLVKSIKYTNRGQCSIELYDAQAALTSIGRHHVLFTDKTEHSGEIGIRNLGDITDDELNRLLSEGTEGRGTSQTLEG